jgi:pimeloyl-ACP methyl ester carboxylesterase
MPNTLNDLTLARLVQVAGIPGAYGPEQFAAIKTLGCNFLQEIRGADLPPNVLEVSFGFLAQQDKALIVCLRGTDPRRLLEWLDDATALPVPCPWGHGLVHAGFLEVYKSLQLAKNSPAAKSVTLADYVRSLLESQQVDAVVVAGHSLGGALGTILVDHLDFLAQNSAFSDFDLSSVTFGSPRVGDADWTHWYDLGSAPTTRRYENPWDVIPNLPTAPPFSHVNNRVRLKAPFGLDLILNHLLSTYIELLEKQ